MPLVHAESSALLEAPAAAVYSILADYHQGHPSILPSQFSNLVVERGGYGDGTMIRFEMTSGGSTRKLRAAITEPEPGRLLVESDLESDAITRFRVEPEEGGVDGKPRTRVTISTEWSSPGLRGWIERLLAPPMLERIYAEELRNLEAAARTAVAAGWAPAPSNASAS